ncbi:hypothetical protein LCGC14_0947410 [marine sediment metagenome]|uniref:Uncharacterized protein n=1 Tax=marine sediment metagenome TaxID=412755 RepID=A0A0F9R1Y1_9ZZZZ
MGKPQREPSRQDVAIKPKINCNYLKRIPSGDECLYWCNLNEHPCSVEYDNEECEEVTDENQST